MANATTPAGNKITRFLKQLFGIKATTATAEKAKTPGKEEEKKTETIQEQEIRENKERYDKLLQELEEFKTQTSLNVEAGKLTDAINRFQHYETMVFENRGFYDGIKGVKDKNVASSANSRAAFIYEHTSSLLNGRIEGLGSELTLAGSNITETNEVLTEEREFNKDIHALKRTEYRYFSKGLAFFYILVGFCLMIADFPISLSIAKYYIDLPVTLSDDFVSKITHPEILLFSVGITFLSVYFKILFDDYILHSIIPDKRKAASRGQTNIVLYIMRLLIKLSILVALLYLLYNIGSMRNATNPLPITPTHKNYVTEKEIFDYKLISFIGMTILLPLLSGICLSVGFGISSNIGNLKKSDQRMKKNESQKKEQEEQKNHLEVMKKMLESLKTEWDKQQQKLNDLTQLFQNSYQRGYRLGHRLKFGYDLYDNANSLFIDHITTFQQS